MSEIEEAGLIKSIRLENFMCHANVQLDFIRGKASNFTDYKNASFIVGPNGSGKSAILSGIVLGLGGKASTMGRAETLGKYVKSGKRYAEITITLTNVGPSAYKPKEYGESIVVKRRIISNGGGSYSLLSDKLRKVSDKKTELVNVLEKFNIDLENPVVILTQDKSREFLASLNPKKLYEFSERSTSLFKLRQKLEETDCHIRDTLLSIKDKKESLRGLEEERTVLEDRLEKCKGVQDLRDQLEKVSCMKLWRKVIDSEKHVEKLEKRIENQEKRSIQLQEKIEGCNQMKKEQLEKMKDVDGEIIKFESARDDKKQEFEEKEELTGQIRRRGVEIRQKLKENNNGIKIKEEEKHLLSRKIKELHEKNDSGNRDRIIAKLQEDKEAIESELNDLDNKRNVVAGDLTHFGPEFERFNSEKIEQERELRIISSKMRDLTQRLNTLKSSKADPAARFGAGLQELNRKINANKRAFQKLPLGPLGAFIKIKDEKWSPAVEKCLGGSVFMFAVDNAQDAKALDRLISEVARDYGARGYEGQRFVKPSIYEAKFGARYDVARSRPQTHFPTVLEVLEIENDAVHNVLVDLKKIESTLLVEDERLLRDLFSSPQPPKGAIDAFTLNCAQYYPNPNFRCYPSNGEAKAMYLSKSVDGQVVSLQTDLEDRKRERQRVEELFREAESRAKEFKHKVDNAHRRQKELNEKRRTLTRKLNDISTKIDDCAPADARILALQEDEHRVNAEIGRLEEEAEGMEQMVRELKLEFAESTLRKENAFKALESAERDLEPYKSKKTKMAKVLSELDNKFHTFETERQKVCQSKRTAEEQIKGDIKDLKKMIAVAERSSGRLEPEQDYSTLEDECTKLKRRLEQRQDIDNEDPDELEKEIKQKSGRLDVVLDEVKKLESLERELKEGNSARIKHYKFLRTSIPEKIKKHFRNNLESRSFDGYIESNHHEQTLNIVVTQTKDGGLRSEKSDLKSLSGGEKSFVTICFILALWEVSESPFRCLDEFDVFMDMVNRKVSTQVLLHFTKTNKLHQFIFLTPLNTSHIDLSEAEVFRLEKIEASTAPIEGSSEGTGGSRKRKLLTANDGDEITNAAENANSP